MMPNVKAQGRAASGASRWSEVLGLIGSQCEDDSGIGNLAD